MIQTVRISDAGEYSVVAGGSVSKATLTVEGKDVQISEPAEKNISVIIFLSLFRVFSSMMSILTSIDITCVSGG